MILLLEPQRPPGFVSGGYRYQDEVAARLATRGGAQQRAIAPQDLETAIAAVAPGTIVVVDGLFAALRRQPLPAGVVALLHQVPDLAPWSTAPLDVIATSQPTADAVASAARRVVVVRPGVGAGFRPDAQPRANDRPRIVCVGTVWPGKGQLLLAEALAAAPLAGNCDLVLLGDHGIAPDYVRRIEAAAPPGMVHRRGVCTPEEVAAELQRADLFVSASRVESFGMAVAEAVACGVPVVAFATGEIASFVQDGTNGWLVPTAAADEQFGRRLQEVIAGPAQLARVRAHARSSAPSLPSWDAVALRFHAACRSLAD